MQLKLTHHAKSRMVQRGITHDDVESAINHPVGPADAGAPGSIWLEGITPGGRRLRMCVDANDQSIIITVAWRNGE